MRLQLILQVAAMAGLISAACMTPVGPTEEETERIQADLVLTEAQHKRMIPVKGGMVVAVLLKANPSTGYTWQAMTLDPEWLEPLGESVYIPAGHEPEGARVGAPERQLFRFRVRGNGKYLLRMGYRRPWEKEEPPLRRFRVTLVAHAD